MFLQTLENNNLKHGQTNFDKIKCIYLSTCSSSVFEFKNKFTRMNLVHYACEYSCHRFLRNLSKVKGALFVLEKLSEPSGYGKNGFHFLAQTHSIKELRFCLNLYESVLLPKENG